MDLNDGKRVWNGLKSKLGINRGQDEGAVDEAYYAEGYEDGYDGYDELEAYGEGYAEGGFDDGYGQGFDAYGDAGFDQGFDDRYAPTTRPASRAGSLPRLVSMSDARASARGDMPLGTSRPARRSLSTSSAFGREVYDSSLPYEMTPEGAAAASARGTRRYEEGFVSPYEAVDASRSGYAEEALSRTSQDLAEGGASALSERTSNSLAALRERIASSGPKPRATAAPTAAAPARSGPRSLTVVKPIRYGEADRVPAALKKGDAVVLVLKGVAGGLDKRILDFSFGAASALDAEVECVADKVFVIAQGSGLTDAERASLSAQGVL